MSDLKKLTKLVKAILEQDERARNSDSYLYLRVIRIFADKKGVDINKMSIPLFLLNMNELGFPPFESVRRTRQKAQAECPELASSKVVAERRAEAEKDYRKFARAAVE